MAYTEYQWMCPTFQQSAILLLLQGNASIDVVKNMKFLYLFETTNFESTLDAQLYVTQTRERLF